MKVSSDELEIGVEYYWSTAKKGKGIFVGRIENCDCFYPTFLDAYNTVFDGTVMFPDKYDKYEEV